MFLVLLSCYNLGDLIIVINPVLIYEKLTFNYRKFVINMHGIVSSGLSCIVFV